MPDLKSQLVITCEHGGNKVPRRYQKYFTKAAKDLASHRGWDPWALNIAQRLSRLLNAPLHFSETSRLLIDLNRSAHHPKILSEFSKQMSATEKQRVLIEHYLPYRSGLEHRVQSLIANKKVVLHYSIHSFTPVLYSEVRNCEIGLLYDPSRMLEAQIAHQLKSTLAALSPDLRIRMNYPYRGYADGLTTHLRTQAPSKSYSGIEIELNQALTHQLEKHKTLEDFSRNLAWAIEETRNFVP